MLWELLRGFEKTTVRDEEKRLIGAIRPVRGGFEMRNSQKELLAAVFWEEGGGCRMRIGGRELAATLKWGRDGAPVRAARILELGFDWQGARYTLRQGPRGECRLLCGSGEAGVYTPGLKASLRLAGREQEPLAAALALLACAMEQAEEYPLV